MEQPVLGITEARASLSSIVEQMRTDAQARVVIGSHRKPIAMIVPFSADRPPAPKPLPVLDLLRARASLVHRIGALSKISAVAVFGSVARGEERADSDIDLLVDVQPEATLFDIAQFGIDMELLFNRPVDVVERAALDRMRDRAMLDDSIAL